MQRLVPARGAPVGKSGLGGGHANSARLFADEGEGLVRRLVCSSSLGFVASSFWGFIVVLFTMPVVLRSSTLDRDCLLLLPVRAFCLMMD
jgi:hypothetical protein